MTGRRLTADAQADRDAFECEFERSGCTCFISPPCGHCMHPGHPLNQEADECWEVVADEPLAPRPILFARLPHMTEPLGRHWGQPRDLRERVRIFETHATIDEAAWQSLPRYESSLPSGVYAGKAWRRGHSLCWYGRDGADGRTRVGYARALIQGAGTNLTYLPEGTMT